MRNPCRQIAQWAVVCGLLTILPVNALAQQIAQPAVVVSIASVDELLANVGYLTRAAGTPDVGGLITLMAGQYVQGLDTKRPAGLFVDLAGPMPTGVAFLPVADFGAIIAKIEEQLGEPEDLGNGIRKIALQREIFFRERGGWVFVSDSIANLENAPRDPTATLGDLPSKYEIAVRLNVQRIPLQLRQMAIAQIREGFEGSLANALETEDREFQEQFGRRGVENVVSFIEDSETVTLGWGVKSDEGITFIDVDVRARPATKLAERFALLDGGTTGFSGFLLPGAAAHLHFTSTATKEDIDQAKLMLKMVRKKVNQEIDEDDDLSTDAARREAKDIVGTLLDVAERTVDAGKFDGGGALYLNEGKLQLVAGGTISDGKAIEDALKRLVKLAKSVENDPNLDKIRFNAESHRGVDLHTLTVPLPADEDDARRVLGENLPIALGTGGREVYLSFGQGSLTRLKAVIDQSASAGAVPAQPLTFDIALRPILSFAASIENDPAVTMLADALVDGQDHVSVTATAVPQGFSYRIQVQEGVLKLIGQAAKLQAGR